MIKLISKYRKELMGAAILLIMFCHSTLHIETDVISKAYNLVRQFSKIGVDLFLLLSGLGLYYSFENDNNVLRFYKKRLRKIAPQYVIVFIFWGIIAVGSSLESLRGYMWRYSLISFYISGELATWFIAAIMLLYLLFPLLYKLLQKGTEYAAGLSILIYALSFCITLSSSEGTPARLIGEAFIVRIPTFIAGIIIGKKIKNGQKNKTYMHRDNIYIITSIIFVVLWLVNTKINTLCGRWIERVLFMPTAICIAVVWGQLLDIFGVRIKRGLSFLGSITLEIYLIHEKVLLVYDTYISKCTVGSLLSNTSAVIISVLLSKLLSNVVGRTLQVAQNSN